MRCGSLPLRKIPPEYWNHADPALRFRKNGGFYGNFYIVDADARIYRSAQPDEASFAELQRIGVRSILNLRQGFRDTAKHPGILAKIREYECGINTGMMDRADLVRALKIIRDAPRPLLIHCLHGADRTGAVVAAYRIVFQDWTPEEAVAEMEHPRYGMHKFFFPNLAALIRRADWPAIRREVLEHGDSSIPASLSVSGD